MLPPDVPPDALFCPGEEGFDYGGPQREVPLIPLAGMIWAAVLVAVAIAVVLVFIHLTHHQPRPAELRGTIQPSTYVPPLGSVTRRPGETYDAFYARWSASPAGVAAWAKARAMVPTLAAEHRAEAIRDARIADNAGRWGPRFAGRRPASDDL